LTLLFEEAGLRYIRLGEHEIVRRIYAAVRDENWGTVPAAVRMVRTDVHSESFVVEFESQHMQPPIDFTWRGTIIGEADGRLTFTMDGVANRTFRKNRIGFCLLHPLGLAGRDVEVIHADGRRTLSRFPRDIAPQNPFLEVVGLAHEAGPGCRVRLHLEGDVFETEDQRNWIDASFKTFCTPLARPFPVEIRAGERVWQKIALELQSTCAVSAAHEAGGGPIELTIVRRPVGPLPQLGFDFPSDGPPLTDGQCQRLRTLAPAHLRCELHLGSAFLPQLQRAVAAARALATRLDLALFVGSSVETELSALLSAVRALEAPIARWSVFPAGGWCTTRPLAIAARVVLRRHDANTPLGGGTVANFCELNRQRPPVEALDFVTWSLQPQEHAFDNASLVETLAAHAATVESARQFCDGLPLVVGPITLKKRVNPYATGIWPPAPAPGELPLSVDVRQWSLYGAAWTLGSIKYLAESGVDAATYYELVGWKGLMERDAGSALPAQSPVPDGGVFPLYHVFADLAELPGAEVLPVLSSDPLRVEALALRQTGQTCLLLANFTDQPQRMRVWSQASSARWRVLDGSNVLSALAEPEPFRNRAAALPLTAGRVEMVLPPFGIARLDLFP